MRIPMKELLVFVFLIQGCLAFTQDNLNPYDTLIANGMTAIQLGEFENAKDIFYAALEVNPEGKEPYHMLGYSYTMDCYNNAQNCELGITFLDKAISTDKYFQHPFYNRALCKSQMGDLKGALADIDAQIELDSTDPAYVLLRAELYFKLDNKEGACTNLNWWKSIKGDLSEGKELIAKLEDYCRE